MTRAERVLVVASRQPITLTFSSHSEAAAYRKRLYKTRSRLGKYKNLSFLLRGPELRIFPRPGDPA